MHVCGLVCGPTVLLCTCVNMIDLFFACNRAVKGPLAQENPGHLYVSVYLLRIVLLMHARLCCV